jgi:hypothetical protein
MKRSIAMSWCAGLAVVLMAAPLSAQTTVQGTVIVQSGQSDTPLADRARRVMGAEVVIVERVQGPRRWWRRGGYRVITVYSDGERFYRRPFGRTVLRKVVVYERGGRYFINDDQWRWHRDYHDRYVRGDRRDNDRDSYDDRKGHDDRNDHDDHGNDRGHGNGHDNGNHYGWDNH